jgi:hypothetical protein
MISALKRASDDLDSGGEISAFLGTQIERDKENRSFTLTQEGLLIQKVIDYCKMQDCSLTTKIPPTTTPFGSDKNGDRWVDQRERSI